MKSDKELLQSFKLFTDKDDIIKLVFLQEVHEPENNIRQAELVVIAVTKILDEGPKKSFNMLIDIKDAGTSTDLPKKTRDIYAKSPIFKRLSKIAVVTPNLLVKILASTMSMAGGKYETIKFYDTNQEALKWLKPSK